QLGQSAELCCDATTQFPTPSQLGAAREAMLVCRFFVASRIALPTGTGVVERMMSPVSIVSWRSFFMAVV
ncbi:MAG TPA: hypothetical protein VF014_00755, partial [Casimicrobiaceae bacterium]|nr:hypothetical protein [Casimicrobiaceae bacterium]